MFECHLTPGSVGDLDFILMLFALAVGLTDQCQPHYFFVESNLLLKVFELVLVLNCCITLKHVGCYSGNSA